MSPDWKKGIILPLYKKRQQKRVQELLRNHSPVYTWESLRPYSLSSDKDKATRSSTAREKWFYPSQINLGQSQYAQYASANTQGVQQTSVNCIR